MRRESANVARAVLNAAWPHRTAGPIDAGGEIVAAWKCRADVQVAHRLGRALHGGRDADGRQRDLHDHRGPSRRGRSAARRRRRPGSGGAIARARVTLSAGRSDNITAAMTARPPAYRIVDSFRPGVIQKGTPPEAWLKVSSRPRHGPVGRHETGRSRNRREHESLDEELSDDARAAGTERGTHGDLPLTCRRPRVDQRADARARNEQHQQHRHVLHRELRDATRYLRSFAEPHHARPEMRVRRRQRRGRPFCRARAARRSPAPA